MPKISIAKVYAIAKAIKNYVEKNKKFPKTITVDKVEYTYGQCAYILSYAINHLTIEFDLITSKNASNPNGTSILKNIYTSDYRDQAERVANYIKKNKQCPNYVTAKSGEKIKPSDFIYAFAKIIVYYNEHNKTLPKYCTYNSNIYTSTTTISNNGLNPYITSSGCSGMGQCTGYYCACNSLQQSFYRLTGIKVPESTIASWAGTTTSGTGHPGIETAVAQFNKKYNKKIKLKWANFSDLGSSNSARWAKLQEYINKGAVFCHLLYRDQWGHYEVPKNVSSDPCQILNSLGDSCGSGTYCGYIENRSRSTQLRYIQGISQKSIAILTI